MSRNTAFHNSPMAEKKETFAMKSFCSGVSYLYFMKNTGNITSTQNIEFNVKS